LISLLLPAVQKVREAANRTQCLNNCKQMGLALHNYHDTFKRFPPSKDDAIYPAAYAALFNPPWTGGIGYTPYWSWMAYILPFIEQDNLWNQSVAWSQTGGGTAAAVKYWWPWGDGTPGVENPALATPVKIYICPSELRNLGSETIAGYADGNIAFTEYLGVDGLRGDTTPDKSGKVSDKSGILISSGFEPYPTYKKRKVNFASISDGTSNTLMIGERPPSADLFYGWWFAGAGFDGSGEGDVTMGARAFVYADNIQTTATVGGGQTTCPYSYVGFQPGKINDPCDQIHFWSWHPGGANWTFGDGSARFLTYTIDNPPAMTPASTFLQLVTRNGGEVITGDY
jgi:prepilin-type processing-associated H-X9-DG protein